jgi:RNA polymerase sigma factor (sigma-70 family)
MRRDGAGVPAILLGREPSGCPAGHQERAGEPAEYPDLLLTYLRERAWNPQAVLPRREWQHCLSMVRAIVRSTQAAGASAVLAEEDLVQEGLLAIVRAAERFNPDLGVPFTGYARAMVRHALQDALRQADPLSRRDRQDMAVLRAAQDTLAEEGNTRPTVGDLSQMCGLTPKRVLQVQDANRREKSSVFERDPEFCTDRTAASPEDAGVESGLRLGLYRALQTLSVREREIVWLRCAQNMPVRDVAARYGISVGRVSQITAQVTGALRVTLSC